jgi:hypothetical protein
MAGCSAGRRRPCRQRAALPPADTSPARGDDAPALPAAQSAACAACHRSSTHGHGPRGLRRPASTERGERRPRRPSGGIVAGANAAPPGGVALAKALREPEVPASRARSSAEVGRAETGRRVLSAATAAYGKNLDLRELLVARDVAGVFARRPRHRRTLVDEKRNHAGISRAQKTFAGIGAARRFSRAAARRARAVGRRPRASSCSTARTGAPPMWRPRAAGGGAAAETGWTLDYDRFVAGAARAAQGLAGHPRGAGSLQLRRRRTVLGTTGHGGAAHGPPRAPREPTRSDDGPVARLLPAKLRSAVPVHPTAYARREPASRSTWRESASPTSTS